MRPQCGLRAELTEAAVEAARKSPVSRTKLRCLCNGVQTINKLS